MKGTPKAGNTDPVLPFAGAIWPKGVRARIQKADRSVTTSGKARAKGWRLTFERRSPPVLDDLMGWTSGDDPLAPVELSFPTLEAAICYAEGQGLSYEVIPPPGATDRQREQLAAAVRLFSDATLDRLKMRWLQDRYGQAMAGAAERGDPVGEDTWADPMDVVADPKLLIEAKRSVLMNWAWSEHLADLATTEGMPENGRPSRLADVEQALLALERRAPFETAKADQTGLAA
ncbi:NADH dehydrogenase ubiquinone Fe-S protein 4 [Rubellimicrobium arenae]|uniref:NADH dehydrogenase ubiquinone Fe-S protein 4 n=1 Tax=Rubellimicrobium arenae TaxID=2817372 RepID=UPI001B3122F5|nr:NADH dehydrogenase ubiquinone Fe-S protein 4 [Rubellimicrobium arenae]